MRKPLLFVVVIGCLFLLGFVLIEQSGQGNVLRLWRLSARNSASIRGRVLAADGQPLDLPRMTTSEQGARAPSRLALTQWVTVMATNAAQNFASQTNVDADGYFTISAPSGTLDLRFSVFGFPGAYPPADRTVTVGEADTVNLGDILLRGPQLQARLVKPNGEPATATWYGIYHTATPGQCPTTNDAVPTPRSPQWNGQAPESDPSFPGLAELSGRTDDQGSFQTGGLPPGAFCLYVAWTGYPINMIKPEAGAFQLTDENSTVDLGDLTVLLPVKRITGFVRNPEGNGLANIAIIAQGPSRQNWPSIAVTDPTGAFALDVDGGEWVITLELTGQSSVTVEPAKQTINIANDRTPESQQVDFTLQQIYLPIIGH